MVRQNQNFLRFIILLIKTNTIYIMKIKNALIKHTKGYLIPTPISYWHTISFVLIYLLVLQIITSIFLAAFYTPDASFASLSIQYLENEISNE